MCAHARLLQSSFLPTEQSAINFSRNIKLFRKHVNIAFNNYQLLESACEYDILIIGEDIKNYKEKSYTKYGMPLI